LYDAQGGENDDEAVDCPYMFLVNGDDVVEHLGRHLVIHLGPPLAVPSLVDDGYVGSPLPGPDEDGAGVARTERPRARRTVHSEREPHRGPLTTVALDTVPHRPRHPLSRIVHAADSPCSTTEARP